MTFWVYWWLWLFAALGLFVMEAVVPSYVFMGLAVGAGLMAAGLPLASALGLQDPSLTFVAFSYAIVSLCSWFLLRRFMKTPDVKVKVWKRDINNNES